MKILVAGPGTGKTTKIKKLIDSDFSKAKKILVLSFTNATVNDLTNSFEKYPNVQVNTLHSYALKINHLPELHILEKFEIFALRRISKKLKIDFDTICKITGCITFDNMVAGCTIFIESNPAYAIDKIGNLDLLIIDEYQDFNTIERQLLDKIISQANETIILGDDDQSIYGFKDADPDGIIEVYNNSLVEKLAHENICYRCPDEVVIGCNNLISRNKNRILKEWHTNGNGGSLIIEQYSLLSEVDIRIMHLILEIKEKNPESSILILSPVGFAVETTKIVFDEVGIEYLDFWNPPIDIELLKSIWWFRVLLGYKPMLNLIFLCDLYSITHRVAILKSIEKFIKEGESEQNCIQLIIDSGILEPSYCKEILVDNDLDSIIKKFPEFRDLANSIDNVNLKESLKSMVRKLKPELSFSNDLVNLMSIHKSKGLQADYVIITGLVEGILPNAANGVDTIESQRRILFVGLSRALKNAYIISSVNWSPKHVNRVDKSKFKYDFRKKMYSGRMSTFVEELK
ncbi:MAG: UvrD-helicase domain-containing protein [Lutibacter sp.]